MSKPRSWNLMPTFPPKDLVFFLVMTPVGIHTFQGGHKSKKSITEKNGSIHYFLSNPKELTPDLIKKNNTILKKMGIVSLHILGRFLTLLPASLPYLPLVSFRLAFCVCDLVEYGYWPRQMEAPVLLMMPLFCQSFFHSQTLSFSSFPAGPHLLLCPLCHGLTGDGVWLCCDTGCSLLRVQAD